MAEPQSDPSAERRDDRAPDSPRPATISSEDLFRGLREIQIRHAGEVYRLRLTRNGKLILHK